MALYKRIRRRYLSWCYEGCTHKGVVCEGVYGRYSIKKGLFKCNKCGAYYINISPTKKKDLRRIKDVEAFERIVAKMEKGDREKSEIYREELYNDL